MRRALRVGNCSGFYGDRADALAELAAGDVDVITGDYLAEVTMLVLAKLRARDANGGYATSFPRQLAPALATISERGLKVVVNAGGLYPAGLADVVRGLVDEAGLTLSVAVVHGDDLLGRLSELDAAGHHLEHLQSGAPLSSWRATPLTANAYLGAWGITCALDAGADIVLTGRVTDASLVVGPAAWWHGWRRDDYDALAGAVAAGHVIECSTQATGGNYSGFRILGDADRPGRPSLPIAEIAADGSAVITKTAGGGAVTVGTVTAQLLYEIGPPEYLNPDVTAHFDTITLEPAGDDRVAVRDTRGSAPPGTTKVAVTALGGHRNSFTTIITGLDVDAKIDWFTAAVTEALAGVDGLDAIEFDRIGTTADSPTTQGEASVVLRTTVTGSEAATGRPFGAAIIELALANFPGFYGLSLPGAATTFGTYWPGLIDQSAVEHLVTLPDGTTRSISPPPDVATDGATDVVAVTADDIPTDPATGDDEPDDSHARVHLGELADARSGDKGGDANVGIWARQPSDWPWLRRQLTTDWVRAALPEASELAIDRYELSNLGAVNFVIHGLLGEGATANTRTDSQAKALGEYLRARWIASPPDPNLREYPR